MNIHEMHEAVKLGLDKTSSLELPAFEPEELDYWLNEAQLQLVKQKTFGNNYRGEGFEDSIKRIEDLTSLVVDSAECDLLFHPFYENVKYVPKSAIGTTDSKYLFFVKATAKYASDNTKVIDTVPTTQKEVKNLIQTEFNIPFIKNPFVYFYDNKIGFIHDPYKDIDKAVIEYIKYPKTLVRTAPDPNNYETNVCELPEQVHPELVALTVNTLLENIESPRLQNNLFQLSKKE